MLSFTKHIARPRPAGVKVLIWIPSRNSKPISFAARTYWKSKTHPLVLQMWADRGCIGGWLGVTAAASVLRLEPGGACRRGGARRGRLASAQARALGPCARSPAARHRAGADGWRQQR